jgi:DNA-directed RNA polymerase I subunit RPA2
MLGKLPDIGKKVEYLLATGNLKSPSGLDLQQASGFTIMADKLNWYRYLSHFRCIHRGAFFSEMKTTAVRKLLPEAFGFLCPVHTPDGAPCGLLNHLAHTCEIVNVVHETGHLPAVLVALGMAPASAGVVYPAAWLPVILDGRVVGMPFRPNAGGSGSASNVT